MDEDGAVPSIPGVPFDKFPLEIQSQIANYLDKKSLFNAILVNKEWFLRLIDLLWCAVSINTVFANTTSIRPKSRRQYYAAKIRMVDFDSWTHPRSHEDLEFQSTQRLDFYSSEIADETWLTPFLTPTLHSLNITATCNMNTRVLNSLRSCTQLQDLSVGGLVRPHNEEDLMAYLREAPSLRTVILQHESFGSLMYREHDDDTSLVTKMLNELLKRGNLEHLVIHRELVQDCLAEHLSTSAEPLPLNGNLRRLHLEAYSPAISVCLSTATARLDSLTLVLLDPGHNIFKHLPNFPNLSKLSLCFAVRRTGIPIKLWQSDLDMLCMMTKLTDLSIKLSLAELLELDWVTDRYFDSWIAHFGRLHNLHLTWNCNLTHAALGSIARSCPRLIHCVLGWRVSLYALSSLLSICPLLPRLQTLCLFQIEAIVANR